MGKLARTLSVILLGALSLSGCAKSKLDFRDDPLDHIKVYMDRRQIDKTKRERILYTCNSIVKNPEEYKMLVDYYNNNPEKMDAGFDYETKYGEIYIPLYCLKPEEREIDKAICAKIYQLKRIRESGKRLEALADRIMQR